MLWWSTKFTLNLICYSHTGFHKKSFKTVDVNKAMSLLTEVSNLSFDLSSVKISVRQKAFNRLNEILNSCRNAELEKLFEKSEDISWTSLFNAAHEGVMTHASKLYNDGTELNVNDPKITIYSRLLQNICESPSDGE